MLRDSRFRGGAVFEQGDKIHLRDHANDGILTTSLEIRVYTYNWRCTILVPSLLVPIIVLFNKHDQLVTTGKVVKLAQIASTDKLDERSLQRLDEPATMKAVNELCGKPLLKVVAGNGHP